MKRSIFSVLLSVLLLLPLSAAAKPYASVKYSLTRSENPKGDKSILILPYAFSADSLGLAYGIGAMVKGYGQEQLTLGATTLGSTDEAAISVLGFWDLRFPWWDRFYLTAVGSIGWYPRQRAYASPGYPAGSIRPGSNDSNESQYLETGGQDNWFDIDLEFVLPLGSAATQAQMHYELQNGLLTSPPTGGQIWNPLKSGVTILLLRQFNRYQSYEIDSQNVIDGTIHPWVLGLYHNNTDFPINPTSGSSQYLAVTRSFPGPDSDWGYTFWEVEASKYFDLGASPTARQRVLALNGWAGDAPTWKMTQNEEGIVDISGRPPFLDGARLGGFYRLRGYPTNRFNGRSVIYSAAEYRHTLRWNPVAGISWLKFLQADWLQLVGFAEGGRVSDSGSFSDLFSDWKLDGGIALRALLAGAVVRLDCGVSEEGVNLWAMLGHPF